MERVNFQVIEKKWQKRFESFNLYNKEGRNFTAWKCFLILQEKYIWVMLEIIP